MFKIDPFDRLIIATSTLRLTVFFVITWLLAEIIEANSSSEIITPSRLSAINGFILLAGLLYILISAIKTIKVNHPLMPILRFSGYGALIVFISAVIFQAIRQFTFHGYSLDERVYYFSKGVIGMTVLGFIISLLISHYIKTKNIVLLVVFIAGILTVFYFQRIYFPELI